VVTYVRWTFHVTTKRCGSGTGCVTISLMILNRVIRRYKIIDCVVKSHIKYLMSYGKMLNLSFIGLQPVPPLCDYKLWIDTERDAEMKRYLHNMVELNIMLEEFRARRISERKCASYFAMKYKMAREDYKEKQEEEMA
jgi:hypothetical protein